jgi:hypothetical protein
MRVKPTIHMARAAATDRPCTPASTSTTWWMATRIMPTKATGTSAIQPRWSTSGRPGLGAEDVARIAWIEDGDATDSVAAAFAQIRGKSHSGSVADILRTMSLRPDFMLAINEASNLHFTDGALTRAQHELIASYVAALNRCHY